MSVPPPCFHAPPFLGGVAGAEAGDDLSRFLRVSPAFASQQLPFATAGRWSAAPLLGLGRAGRGGRSALLPPGLGLTGRGGGVPVATAGGGGGGGFDGMGGSKLLPEDLLPWLASACLRTAVDPTKNGRRAGESGGKVINARLPVKASTSCSDLKPSK